MMKIFLCIVIIVFFVLVCYGVKNHVTFKQRMRISLAIRKYCESMAISGLPRSTWLNAIDIYNRMEPYDCTFYRFWDWGYKNILPPDDFNKIKGYIK